MVKSTNEKGENILAESTNLGLKNNKKFQESKIHTFFL